MSIDALLARIEAQASLNAFIGFDAAAAAARWQTRAVNNAGSLSGWSLAVKDNIDLDGLASTAGTPALTESVAVRTASALQRLLDAGAWVVGKTNLHELAFGVTSDNAHFGAVGNPRDPTRSAGGSSGGSAAAVAAGLADAALGTDTGGSVRVPASFCGLVGFRPSIGRYPADGVVPLARSRDTIGLLARSTHDIAALDQAICSGDTQLTEHMRPLRLGYPRGFLTDALDAPVANVWRRSLNRLRESEHALIDVEVGDLWALIDQASPVVTGFELRRDFSTHVLTRAPGMNEEQFVSQIASPDVRSLFAAIVLQGRAPSADQYSQVCERVLPAMHALIESIFAQLALDAWIFPTTPTSAFPLGAGDILSVNGESMPLFRTTVRNLQQASLIGMPSISIPMSVSSGALPAGLCIECLPGQDWPLLSVARTVERALHDA